MATLTMSIRALVAKLTAEGIDQNATVAVQVGEDEFYYDAIDVLTDGEGRVVLRGHSEISTGYELFSLED